ncbi:MAG: BTAD domain-containing putative transcriptional regulator [Oscillospiraceae bacterium]
MKTIRVEMLGGLSVWADGKPLLTNCVKINKPWQVFCFLLLYPQKPAGAALLLDALWGEADLANPANVLKNTVYALRREFGQPVEGEESPVLFENGGYVYNPAIQLRLDVQDFVDAVAAASEAEGEEKIALFAKAAGLYRGDLLPPLATEAWVLPRSLLLREKYSRSVQRLTAFLHREGRFEELLEVAGAASRIDPLEEEYYRSSFKALYALGRYRDIADAYRKVENILNGHLGAEPCAEVRQLYEAAAQRLNQIEQDIAVIKKDLKEAAGKKNPASGPLYCSYHSFKSLYQMVGRYSERSREKIMVVLLSLQMQNGGQPGEAGRAFGMEYIKKSIMEGLLRRNDVMARYSASQYIIMLSAEQSSGAEVVIQRLRKNFEKPLAAKGLKIVAALSELERMR